MGSLGRGGDKRASTLEAHPTKALRGTGEEMQKGVADVVTPLKLVCAGAGAEVFL